MLVLLLVLLLLVC